jgi:hypothetical protein
VGAAQVIAEVVGQLVAASEEVDVQVVQMPMVKGGAETQKDGPGGRARALAENANAFLAEEGAAG